MIEENRRYKVVRDIGEIFTRGSDGTLTRVDEAYRANGVRRAFRAGEEVSAESIGLDVLAYLDSLNVLKPLPIPLHKKLAADVQPVLINPLVEAEPSGPKCPTCGNPIDKEDLN